MSKWKYASGGKKKYNYGKSFKRNGKMVQYRYTNGKKGTKKLVPAKKGRRS